MPIAGGTKNVAASACATDDLPARVAPEIPTTNGLIWLGLFITATASSLLQRSPERPPGREAQCHF